MPISCLNRECGSTNRHTFSNQILLMFIDVNIGEHSPQEPPSAGRPSWRPSWPRAPPRRPPRRSRSRPRHRSPSPPPPRPRAARPQRTAARPRRTAGRGYLATSRVDTVHSCIAIDYFIKLLEPFLHHLIHIKQI